MTDFVLGFAFHGDWVLLIQKTKPEWQIGKFNGLGGKIESGEYAAQAMVREFEEECGIHIPEDRWTQYATMRSGPHVIYVFKAEIAASVSDHSFKRTNEGRVGLYRWQGLPFRALPNLSWLVPLAKMEDGVRADIFYPRDPPEKK